MQLVPLQRGHRSEPLSCDSVHAVPHSGHECSVVFIGMVRLVFRFPEWPELARGRGEAPQMQCFEKERGAPLRDGREKSPGGFRGEMKGSSCLSSVGFGVTTPCSEKNYPIRVKPERFRCHEKMDGSSERTAMTAEAREIPLIEGDPKPQRYTL